MKMYKVGDPVWWTPDVGSWHLAVITGIELTQRPDEKYGEQVDEIDTETKLFVMDVRLTVAPPVGVRYERNKWCRPDQVAHMSEVDRKRYMNINTNEDD